MRQLANNSENNTSMFLKEELTVPRPRRSMIFHRKQNAFDSDLRPFALHLIDLIRKWDNPHPQRREVDFKVTKITFTSFGWCIIEIIDNLTSPRFHFAKNAMGVWMHVAEGLGLNWDRFVKWLHHGKTVYVFRKVFTNWVEVMFLFNLPIHFSDFIIIHVQYSVLFDRFAYQRLRRRLLIVTWSRFREKFIYNSCKNRPWLSGTLGSVAWIGDWKGTSLYRASTQENCIVYLL